MNTRILSGIAILLLFISQTIVAGTGKQSWTQLDNNRVTYQGTRIIEASHYKSYRLDLPSWSQLLLDAPIFAAANKTAGILIDIPMPDGTFQEFRVFKSELMPGELAEKYPEIRAYDAEGITDRSATAKLDITPAGFHGMILSASGTVYIDPFTLQDNENYMVYYKRDFVTTKEYTCLTHSEDVIANDLERAGFIAPGAAKSVGSQLKTYRLALATTGEYATFHGGTVAGALAAMVTSVNRVTGVYEREFAIRMTLVPNTDTLIFTNAATDPYTNNDGSAMLGQNQTTVTARIGSANYDIGHVFSTGGGGIAGLGVVCNGTSKARGVTGLYAPVGDPFDIDYVAHEMGHQFGGNHTFNCEIGSCDNNRAFNAAYEPGSGSTIMAYAGICGNNNLQSNSDDYFHTKSFDEITIYTTTGIGGFCPVTTPTGNTPPVINPTANYTIPYLTPFRLIGDASDPDGDPITYCWEQHNLGPAGAWNAPSGNAPIFRSFDPSVSTTRLFPKLSNILNNNVTIGEVKPAYARVLAFKLTVRDNKLNGGGVTNTDSTVKVTVINTGQAFAVTSPNVTGIIWQAGGVATVTWDVGGSDVAPVSTPNVNILLSTDGGQTFPTVLAQSVPNNGSYIVNVPISLTITARVMVEGDGNIFFDINDKNFEIGTVGIGELNGSNGIFIGPNPVQNSFEVIVNNPAVLKQHENRFQVFDITGRFVSEFAVVNDRTTVDVRTWSRGIYSYRFLNSEGIISTGKIVVQ